MIAALARLVVERRRLWILAAVLLTLVGAAAWATMPRAEDPRLPERNGRILVVWPGADALRVERLVVRPLEDELAEVAEIATVEATAQADLALLHIELAERIYDTDAAWDAVQDAIDAARPDLPEGLTELELAHDFSDAEAVIVRIEGSHDPVALEAAADRVEDRLLRVPGAKRVLRAGAPGTQVSVALEPTTARRLGLTPATLAQQLDGANATIPGGTVRVDGRTVIVRPDTEPTDLEALRDWPVVLPSGAGIPLREVATIALEVEQPRTELAHHDGAPMVTVSVVPRAGLDVVAFGDRVQAALDEVRPEIAPLELSIFADQPAQVSSRLADLGLSLLLGIAIVAGVLFLAMGPRLGVVVSAVVPLVALSTVALYAAGGGVLHQLSIAALVIALGLLVDNAIVVAEAVQARRDQGEGRWEAASGAITELAVPLATATATTLAAFVPMLLAPGVTSDFTRAIPTVIMVALAISYVFAVGVTPILAGWLLRPRRRSTDRVGGLGDRLAALAVGRPWWTLAGVGGVLAVAGLLGTAVTAEFFPYADRARFTATVQLPEGSDLDATREVAARVGAWARAQPEVTEVDTFTGRSAPRFYYNIPIVPRAPHLAQLVVTTERADQVPALVARIRDHGRTAIPEALVTARRLQQGPPTGAPVEVRLEGRDLADLGRAADQVMAALRALPGTSGVRHDLGLGQPTLEVVVDEAATGRRGLTPRGVAVALLGQTRGVDAAPFRAGDEPLPLRIRGPAGQDTPVAHLAALDVPGPRGLTPLAAVASPSLSFGPSAIHRRDGRRVVTVSSELADGATFSTVSAALRPALSELPLPEGVDLALGGEAEASGEANAAILGALPLGVLLLLGALLLEFNSFRRVGLVLVTVPLAFAGVLPGLVLGGQPFGFMSLLGVIALVGIVVNNAIVLLDVVDRGLEAGRTVPEAVADAIRVRVRPILLTTATTVAGLVPLALSSSTLWPPLASAMISGLLASTVLTLLAVPALARLVLRPRRTA
jgi:multidrug efflux pump subunit AcrB